MNIKIHVGPSRSFRRRLLGLELEDEKVNPKFAQMAVKAYLQRAQFHRDTRVELGGMEIGVYE